MCTYLVYANVPKLQIIWALLSELEIKIINKLHIHKNV